MPNTTTDTTHTHTTAEENILEGKWHQLKGKVKEEWADLTDDDLKEINGKREKLAGRLQERYGWNQTMADEKINTFLNRHRNW